jgi:hypothetical protein
MHSGVDPLLGSYLLSQRARGLAQLVAVHQLVK